MSQLTGEEDNTELRRKTVNTEVTGDKKDHLVLFSRMDNLSAAAASILLVGLLVIHYLWWSD